MPAVLGASAWADYQVDQRLRGQVIEEGEPLLDGQVIQSHIFGQKRRLPGKTAWVRHNATVIPEASSRVTAKPTMQRL